MFLLSWFKMIIIIFYLLSVLSLMSFFLPNIDKMSSTRSSSPSYSAIAYIGKNSKNFFLEPYISWTLSCALPLCYIHRLINNNRRDTRCRLFKIYVFFFHNNPEAKEFRADSVELQDMRVTPLGLCLRVNVNEQPLNLKKTTYSVLSAIDLWLYSFLSALFWVFRKSFFNFLITWSLSFSFLCSMTAGLPSPHSTLIWLLYCIVFSPILFSNGIWSIEEKIIRLYHPSSIIDNLTPII